MPNLQNGSKGDSSPGSLDCESGVLPLSYRAPHDTSYYIILPGIAIRIISRYLCITDNIEVLLKKPDLILKY